MNGVPSWRMAATSLPRPTRLTGPRNRSAWMGSETTSDRKACRNPRGVDWKKTQNLGSSNMHMSACKTWGQLRVTKPGLKKLRPLEKSLTVFRRSTRLVFHSTPTDMVSCSRCYKTVPIRLSWAKLFRCLRVLWFCLSSPGSDLWVFIMFLREGGGQLCRRHGRDTTTRCCSAHVLTADTFSSR